jgi:hypothetical protein
MCKRGIERWIGGLVCVFQRKSEVNYQKINPAHLVTTAEEHQKHRIWIDHETSCWGKWPNLVEFPTDFAMQIIGFIRRR